MRMRLVCSFVLPVALLSLGGAAFAQPISSESPGSGSGTPPGGGGSTSTSPNTDTLEYALASAMWDWVDSGVGTAPLPPYVTSPGGMRAQVMPFARPRLTLSWLYRHRLDNTSVFTQTSSLDALIAADATIQNALRVSSTTGVVRTSMQDMTAYNRHMMKVVEGITLGGWTIESAGLTFGEDWIQSKMEPLYEAARTEDLPVLEQLFGAAVVEEPCEATTESEALPPSGSGGPSGGGGSGGSGGGSGGPKKCVVSGLVTGSGLMNADDCLYAEDLGSGIGEQQFDCDDFADALGAYLVNKLRAQYPNIKYKILVICSRGTCHAITVLYSGNQFWIADAQSGEMRGPFVMGSGGPDPDLLKQIIAGMLNGHYGEPPSDLFGDPDRLTLNGWWDPNTRPNNEPPVWWTDIAMRTHFCACMKKLPAYRGKTCDEIVNMFIWPPRNLHTPDVH